MPDHAAGDADPRGPTPATLPPDEAHPGSDEAVLRALLRDALRNAPPEAGGDTAALQQRVLSQWQAAHGPAAAAAPAIVAAAGGAATVRTGGSRGRTPGPAWWLAALALAALLALATAQRSDPVLQELLPVDVLSELAGGAL
jgi:hypothetical protein